MRFWTVLTCAFAACGWAAPGPAAAAELQPLPVFFQQSWDMVKQQPLASLSVAPAGALAAKPAGASPAAPAPPHMPATRNIATVSIPMPSEGGQAPVVIPTPGDEADPAAGADAGPDDAPPPVEAKPIDMAKVDVTVPPERPAAADAAAADPATPDAGSDTASAADGDPVTLKVPKDVQVRDRASFMVGNKLYRLTSIEGLGVDTRCAPEKGKRCYWRPMRSLKRAIAGVTLYCTPATGGAWTCSKKQGA